MYYEGANEERKSELEKALTEAPAILARIKNAIFEVRSQVVPKLTPSFQAFTQAKVDMDAVKKPCAHYFRIALASIIMSCLIAAQYQK